MSSHHRFLGYDEGRQTLGTYDTGRPDWGWTLDLAELPLARDLQRLPGGRALVGFDRGFFEVDLANGRVLSVADRWKGVTSVRRLEDGSTLVSGVNLCEPGVNVLTVEPRGTFRTARRDGDYVRLVRPTEAGTLLLCTDDHILETTADLIAIRRLAAPGFRHAWMPHRFDDGSTLVSGGYGPFLASFDPAGALLMTWGGVGEVPDEVQPHFYASFEVLPDGGVLVANWQGHGPDNGNKGRQLIEFGPKGTFCDAWSHPGISSLQGILTLP